MPRSASERLRRFYEQFSADDHVLVTISADPDAIASAMAVKRLLWRRVSAVTIANINEIQRCDNQAMVRLLGVALVPIAALELARFDRFVMVDSQPCHSPCFAGYSPHAVIDHHPDSGAKAPFLDIRPRYGATATMLTEYLRAARIKPSMKLATGLFYAIKTDTHTFTRQAQIEDVRAFQFLFRRANMHLVRRIEQAEMPLSFLKDLRDAFARLHIRRQRAFAHLGAVVSPDVCVLVADFCMRMESVTWSIISGIHDNKLIIVFRNDGMRKSAGIVAKQSFGALGSAGGHKSMARAELPLEELKKHVDVKNATSLARWIAGKIEMKADPQ